jgi:Zn-dependent protease with chaperone function
LPARIGKLALLTLSTVFLANCNAETMSRRSGGLGLTDKAEDLKVDETPTPTPTPTVIPDPPNLPAYLLKRADAEALATQLILPYQIPLSPQHTISPISNNFESFRSFTESFMNTALALQIFSPGRVFKTHVLNEDQVNASADGYQRIMINKGAIADFNQKEMMAVLCHEISHSGRNHSVKLVEAIEKQLGPQNAPNPEYAALVAEMNVYLNAQFNPSTLIYRHNLATYAPIRKNFDEFFLSLSNLRKRAESEADIVGAMTCAKLGMPAQEIPTHLIDALPAHDVKDDADHLADGVGLKFISEEIAEEVLPDYLFPIGSHPTNEERKEQITRLLDIITAQEDLTQMSFQNWLDGSTGFLKPVSTSLTLTAAVRNDHAGANILTVIGSGKKIYVPKPEHDGIKIPIKLEK